VRALLIVNSHATSTTQVRRDVIAHALASELELEVVHTRYRGHAADVAEAAAQAGFGLVLTLGGDGTVNEAVNGLLRKPGSGAAAPDAAGAAALDGAWQPGRQHTRRRKPGPAAPPGVPLLAALPGGHANVFTRALGLPADPIDATGRILAALPAGRGRTIGVGLADDRYFCFNAGLGFDAEVVRMVEGLRARGETASSALYLWAGLRQFYSVTNRREPPLTLERAPAAAVTGLFCGIVSNTSPWTYLGRRPVRASPRAGFDTGLDLFALRAVSSFGALNVIRQMLANGSGPRGKAVVSLHDCDGFTLRASRPVAFQVDGEYMGEREHVTFHSIPNALRVIA
jgi:diacylglycerol kinase family enzyme